MKIEAAAMKAFQKDIAHNPDKAKEYSTTPSMLNKLKSVPSYSQPLAKVGRFGESNEVEESHTLVWGREKALDTISQKLANKAQWLEGKTAEGISYYWNKDSMGMKLKFNLILINISFSFYFLFF